MMPCQALGILEALWHVTAELAPAGNIGRLSNKAIAMEMFYEGEPDKLVKALISSGHLDISATHRLIVHDWSQHADYNTRRKVERRGGAMVSHDASSSVVTRHESIPEPVPEPVPDPVPEPEVSTPNGVSPRADSGKLEPVEAIYREYPRKVGKQVALKAIKRAIQHVKARGHTLREAEVWLFRRVQCYARSPAGNDGEFTPHPATWFNQGRYDDADEEWQRRGSGSQVEDTSLGELIRRRRAERGMAGGDSLGSLGISSAQSRAETLTH